MKRRVLTSIAASVAIVGVIGLTGCGSSSSPKTQIQQPPATTPGDSASIIIENEQGSRTSIDPTVGGTVVIGRNNENGTNTVATVVHGELNECANATSDDDGDGVICGPKEGVTYAFQSDFGALGAQDTDPNTPDGGVLLYDAYTIYNGVQHDTPLEGNQSENRIQEVYIPSNYIKLTNDLKNSSVDAQYEAMRQYLANVCNMQCFAAEPENNPYFKDGKTKGSFVATFVMHFTRGTGEKTLMEQFQTDRTDLEYLTVSFHLDVEQVDGNSSKLRFTSPADTPVTFGAKKHGEGGLIVNTTNVDINSIIHQTVDADNALTINMAKYFDKLIAKGDSLGVADEAKKILVDNAQNPWPVKIYGTLHEMKNDGTYDRSFVRNPAKLDAELFGLTAGGAYKEAFIADPHGQAEKFNIVFPGGKYN